MSQLQFDLDHVIDTLASEGWVVIPHALSAAITANLRTACLEVWQQGLFHEAATGRAFGDTSQPLLLSVRSGSRTSMPGMMDTVLNLGLNDVTVEAVAQASGDARFAWDSYRRFIQMYSDVVLGLDHHRFEDALEIVKEDNGFFNDVELGAEHWQALVGDWRKPTPRLHADYRTSKVTV